MSIYQKLATKAPCFSYGDEVALLLFKKLVDIISHMKGRAVGSKNTLCRKIQRRSQYCGTGRTKSIYGDNIKVVVAEAPATT